MEITESELTVQYQRANSAWPFIHQTELSRGLPKMLTNEVGDCGHGHGVWQLDDRSHTPPGGFPHFDANVSLQCATAAAMLQGILATTGGNVEEAAAIYNSGQPGEPGTTHHDYGIDVLERMQFLRQKKTGAAPDGVFGPVTQVHVVSFQSHHGLTADGIVGPLTARALGS